MSSYDLHQNVEKYTISDDVLYDGVEVYTDDGTLIGSAPPNTVLDNPMVLTFPWNNSIGGTNEGQLVAANIWAEIGGYAYKPFQGQNAISNPALELGDSIKLDSVTHVLASRDIIADMMYTEDIGAPQKNETDPEFDPEGALYTPTDIKNAIKRVSKAAASLKVDYNSITAEILDIDGVLAASLTFNEQGLIVTNGSPSVATTISGSQITTQDLNLTGRIAWADLTTACQTRVDANKGDPNPSYIKSTYIDSTNVIAPGIYGGDLWATGQGNTSGTTSAFYLADGWNGNYSSPSATPKGWLCYDKNGVAPDEAQNRVFLRSVADVALKIQAGENNHWSNMSIEAAKLYLECPLVISSASYGTNAPTGAGVQGQLYFQISTSS